MSILDKHYHFVNEQIEFHLQSAKRYGTNKYRSVKHLETAETFKSLFEDMRQASEKLEAQAKTSEVATPQKQFRLSLTPEELEGLPEDLLNELSGADRTEYLIINILEDSGGVASLDRLLVEIYRRTNEVTKRNTLTSRLYRMAQKNLVHSVPGKKGVYSLQQLSKEEVDLCVDDQPSLFASA